MAQIDNKYAQGTRAGTDVAIDQGLRAYMVSVYNYMAGGIFLTGLVAYATFAAAVVERSGPGPRVLTEFGQLLYTSPLRWVVMLSPLAIVFFLSFRVNTLSVSAAQLSFWLFAAVMGVSLSSIFLVFTGESVTQVFFVTAAAFAALSLYGYTTKSNLSALGTFLIMGVFGIIVAGLVNLWLQSSAVQFAISAIGVLVFAGLTAYDTQRIKDGYLGIKDGYLEVKDDMTATSKAAILGALSLYLDFINMFTMLLSLFGRRQ